MMQNLGNRRSVQKCAQNAGSNVLNVIAEHAVQGEILKYVIYTCTHTLIDTYRKT